MMVDNNNHVITEDVNIDSNRLATINIYKKLQL